MNLSFEGKRLRAAIRAVMKKNGYGYADLARALDVSLPTIKRIMTREDFSLERLFAISDWLGISLAELVHLAEEAGDGATRFTPAQERYFVEQPRALLFFHGLLTGWKPAEFVEQHGFAPKELQRTLVGLDRVGLIELWPGDRVRLRVRGYFAMNPGGALEKRYFEPAVEAIWKRVRSRAPSNGVLLFRPFELTLKEATYRELTRELHELIGKYRGLSAVQMNLEPRKSLRSYSGVVASDEYFVWADILEPGRRSRKPGATRVVAD